MQKNYTEVENSGRKIRLLFFFVEIKKKLYIYTVNDLDAAREYRKKGAAGICSDYLLDTDLDFDKKGIKINYEN